MSSLFNLATVTAAGGHILRSGYKIQRSVRFRSSASAYFNRTFTSVGTRTKFTYSAWLKRGTLGSFSRFLSDSTNNSYLRFNTSNALDWNFHNGTSSFTIVTSQVFRDPSAWYHVIVAVDTTQATNTNRVKIYVNGSQVTAFSSSAYPNQNDVSGFNNNTAHYISSYSATAEFLDGYLTEVNFIDGQALTPSSFGETNTLTGVWQPKKYNGTYGTNGFYLNFSDNSAATAAAIGKDYSGNGNNWTPNNISVTADATYDSMLDVPTQWADGGNGRGNYCVMNPLDRNSSGTVADGNLKWSAGAAQVCVRGTFAIPSSGKWYMECVVGSASSSVVGVSFGLATADVSLTSSAGATGLYQLYASTNRQINLNNSTTGSISGGFSANDVLQIAVDVDNNKMWLGVNNTWYDSTYTANGNPTSGANATSTTSMVGLFPFSNVYSNNVNWNFGQRPFSYTPPTGFKALNTLNLPTPTILKGNQYMDATTYTGNGTTQSIVNSGGMQPDLVWGKSRSNATSHLLVNSVCGTGFYLVSNSTNAEGSASDTVTAFNSNGFNLGADTTLNTSARTYVAWQWKKGATQGFDIVTYTGNSTASRTIAHSLGVTPAMIIVKNRSAVQNWPVAHTSLAANNLLTLDTTGASTSAGTRLLLGNSSTFTVGDAADYGITNQTSQNYVAYCFSEVAGFSKFGSYTGNGSADGTFVFCGFRPRFVMIKRTDSTGNWAVWDTARDTFNAVKYELVPNSSAAETTAAGDRMDILSNGFKLRNVGVGYNASGGTYIFAAFAENSFKNALAR